MTKFEQLLQHAYDLGVEVTEDKHLPPPFRGLYLRDGRGGSQIVLRAGLAESERACVLAEELAHHEQGAGDLRTMGYVALSRQETRAIAQAITLLVPLEELMQAVRSGVHSAAELGEALGVSPEFVPYVVAYYRAKYPAQFPPGA